MISLEKIADAFEERFEDCTQYLNIETGEVINVPNSPWVFGKEEYNQLQTLVDEEEEYYMLPADYELRDKPIMYAFAESIEEKNVSEQLLSQLHRSHPYRHYKDMVFELGIEQEYYDFLHKSYVEIAREWCKHHKLKYSDI